MDGLHLGSTNRRLVVIGGACVAAVAVAHVVGRRRRRARDVKLGNGSAPSSKTLETVATISHASVSLATEPRAPAEIAKKDVAAFEADEVTWESLGNWAACLRKKDTKQLPTLLHWTQRLLEERPNDAALPNCIVAMQLLFSPGHELVDKIATVALRAASLQLERSLELLTALFKGRKDRRHRGPKTNAAMVELATGALRKGIDGFVERGIYQKAAQLLHFLVEDIETRTLVVARGGHTLMLSAMEKFATDPGVILEAVCFVRCLASNTNLDLGRVLSATISALRRFVEKGELQWRTLALLHTLPVWDASDAGLEVATLAVASADQHPRFDSVVEWVAKVLCRLAQNKDSRVRDWLRLPSQITWLEKFRDLPHTLRAPNKEAEQWVAELWRLCK